MSGSHDRYAFDRKSATPRVGYESGLHPLSWRAFSRGTNNWGPCDLPATSRRIGLRSRLPHRKAALARRSGCAQTMEASSAAPSSKSAPGQRSPV